MFVALCLLSNKGLSGPAVRSLTQEDVEQTLLIVCLEETPPASDQS